MGFLNFFNGGQKGEGQPTFGTTADRNALKKKLELNLRKRGFSRMEVKEVLDVITLAEADIKIAEDSLAHINVNNPDPTRAMHAAMQDIRRYQKELEYNIRKKIMDIMARKRAMRGK